MRGRVLMSGRRVGLQVAAVAAVYGGIELPCGGQREAGHLAARILRRLVAGDLDDAETTAFAAGLVDGLLIGEPFGAWMMSLTW